MLVNRLCQSMNMKFFLVFCVALISIVVSTALIGMSIRQQASLSLETRNTVGKIAISESDLNMLPPRNTTQSDFQLETTILPSTFSEMDDSSESSVLPETPSDTPIVGHSKQPSSVKKNYLLEENVPTRSSSEEESAFPFKEHYGILLDQVPSAITYLPSSQFSLDSSRSLITSMLPIESAWYSRNFTFSSDQWFCFPPLFTSREPTFKSFLDTLQRHYVASYVICLFISLQRIQTKHNQ